MFKIKFEKYDLEPSKNITPDIIYQHFNWRNDKLVTCNNIVAFGNVKEPIWWNRPYQSDIVIKQEPDGLYSYNLPYIYRQNNIKTKYNLLVNKNSVPLLILIKLDKTWTAKQYNILNNHLAINAVYKALIKLGVNKEKLKIVNNDIIYDNKKKFMGTESSMLGGWFGLAAIVTLRYTEEKDIFNRLSGKYAAQRGICGIQEETNDIFTKEEFIEAVTIELQKILSILT